MDVRYARRSEYPMIAEFLRTYWAPNHIYARNEPLFRWSFDRPELWDHDAFSFAVALDGGDCLGVLGAIPFIANLRGQTRPAVWLANWMTAPGERTSLTGLRLLRQFDRKPIELIVSFGINADVARIYRAMKWTVVDDTPRWIAFAADQRRRSERLIRAANPDIAGSELESVIRHFSLPAIAATSPDPTPGFDSEAWDRAGWRRFAPHLVGAARDSSYLAWRYLSHPDLDYRVHLLPDGEGLGLLVYRLETIHLAADAEDSTARVPIDRVVRVVELLPASEANLASMLGVLHGVLEEEDAIGYDWWGYYGPAIDWIGRLGVAQVDSHPAGRRLPSRFQPLEPSGGSIMSALKVPLGVPGVGAGSPWYWTKSDSDQDRPN